MPLKTEQAQLKTKRTQMFHSKFNTNKRSTSRKFQYEG